MLMPNRRIFLSNSLGRVIHASNVFFASKPSTENKQKKFNPQKILQSAESSIKPYLNVNKINCLKGFCQTNNELKCSYNFVKDESVAQDIVQKILVYSGKDPGIISEGNPGLGLITIQLILSGIPDILVFDNSNMQELVLNQLIERHPTKIVKKNSNMNKSLDPILINSLDHSQKLGLPVTIVGITTSYAFIKGLIYNFLKYSLWKHQLTIFLVISSQILVDITDRNFCRLRFPAACMFKNFFSIEKVEKYPRDAFLPYCKGSSDNMHLVRISVNNKAFDIIPSEELEQYYFFLKILGTHVRNHIIPTLEKWLPNCGPYLIAKGIGMTTQVQDLLPEEIILLYKIFKNCEGYSDFEACSAKILLTF